MKPTSRMKIELALIRALLTLYLTRHWFGGAGWSAAAILTFFVPVAYMKISRRILAEIYLTKKNLKESLSYGLIGSVALVSTSVLILHYFLGGFYLPPELKEPVWWFPVASFLGTLLTTGLYEEVFFRGFLQMHLKGYLSDFWDVLVQAVIFALLHPRYYIEGLYYISFLAFAFGAVAGFIALRTRNLSGPILMHGLYDTAGLMLFYVHPIVPGAR